MGESPQDPPPEEPKKDEEKKKKKDDEPEEQKAELKNYRVSPICSPFTAIAYI